MISYRWLNTLIFAAYLAPIILLGFFVQHRIEERQVTLQLYLQNQVDVDRKIMAQRTLIRGLQPPVRSFLLRGSPETERAELSEFIRDSRAKFNDFWTKYELNYAGAQRPFLQSVLRKTEELDVIDEEARAVRNIRNHSAFYATKLLNHVENPAPGQPAVVELLAELDGMRDDITNSFNDLADIRYIFAQRAVYLAVGENATQRGFFGTVFVALFFTILITALLEHFFVRRPFGDIMSFLRELARGRSGQRIYFSSPVREIRESEEAINTFIDRAERKD